MIDPLKSIISSTINVAAGSNVGIAETLPLSGGSINQVTRVTLEDGRDFVLKLNPESAPRFFSAEAEGLRAIGETNTIRVPRVFAVNDLREAGHSGYLVLESVETSSPGKQFFVKFGRQLAMMHQASRVPHKFGFAEDNFLGLSVQSNGWKDHWIQFWCEHRIGFQLKLAIDNGWADALLGKTSDRFLARLPELLKTADEEGSLLHGDLWSGNFLCDRSQSPVLIDPAVYFGHREAEFGMTTLFGGFDQSFYDAYNEAWPLESGYHERIEVYRLYHLLNHLHLFGNSYLGGCMEILRKYQ